ncbi:MAG: copper-translocating P-type ATPase [Clostridia bacterium]|nr:copper-translocating P-type ATPase [Clostridia bacterium]
MEKYNVTGMSCAACSARVERVVKAIGGVTECSVNLLTNSMEVSGSASAKQIISAVKAAGYGASKVGEEEKSDGNETPRLVRRLVWSAILLAVLMYVSMGHTMWGFPLPKVFERIPIAVAALQMVLALAVMIINGHFFTSGLKGILNRAPNMDTLVALGSSAAFIYSAAATFLMIGKPATEAAHLLRDLYFESAAMILALITVGKMLEARAKGKTTDALKGLMKLAPKTATVIRDGKETVVHVDEVRIGEVFVVRAGESIPLDGNVISGSCTADESALTGESMPVDKASGDKIYAATLCLSGFITCEAASLSTETAFSGIIKMVSDAAASKAPAQKLADKVSGIFVPTVIGIAVVTFIAWLIADKTVGYALARAISVLVISCPCALGLATPVAIMVASGVGAKNGILFKTAASLEETGKIKTAMLDKTGTITLGKPKVTDVICANGSLADELVSLAASLEYPSEHPLAKAVVAYAEENGIKILEASDFETLVGRGVRAKLGEDAVFGGSVASIERICELPSAAKTVADNLSSQGKTPLCFAKNNEYIGILAVADIIKEDSAAAISQFRKMGIRTVMLTGDNERTARAIADKVGIDEIRAGVMPEDKAEIVKEFSALGRVCMIGDGINDAPALASADTGIAIGAGADVAIDSAEVVLMHSRLTDAVTAIKLSRAALRNIVQNLFWAFFYNAVGIPLAAGLFIPITGWELSPMFGAAAMSLSSFCVVLNALRLNLFKTVKTPEERI